MTPETFSQDELDVIPNSWGQLQVSNTMLSSKYDMIYMNATWSNKWKPLTAMIVQTYKQLSTNIIS